MIQKGLDSVQNHSRISGRLMNTIVQEKLGVLFSELTITAKLLDSSKLRSFPLGRGLGQTMPVTGSHRMIDVFP
jgi:hypothetical protein